MPLTVSLDVRIVTEMHVQSQTQARWPTNVKRVQLPKSGWLVSAGTPLGSALLEKSKLEPLSAERHGALRDRFSLRCPIHYQPRYTVFKTPIPLKMLRANLYQEEIY